MHHNLHAISHESEDISVTKGLYRKNSSDSDIRRRLKLKSEEFFYRLYNPLVIEILRCEDSTFLIHTALIRSLTRVREVQRRYEVEEMEQLECRRRRTRARHLQ